MPGSTTSTGRFAAALALALLGPASARAYVTSATLEYSVDSRARIYLNGHLVVGDTGPHFPDYAVLSTSDGSLPLEDFVPNAENVLAVENQDPDGGLMGISYRLTVHHSNGDPVVIWGLPGQTRLLHLHAGQAQPEGWTQPGFDDSQWPNAEHMSYGTLWYTYPELPDPAFGGALGFQGVVPHISHSSSGADNPGDVNLCRSRFRFPYTAAKTRLFVNPASAKRGEAVALRLLPGGDAPDLGAFTLYADLPEGLAVLSAPKASLYDRQKRRLGWAFPTAQASVRYVTLSAAAVVSAPGWGAPQKVLGGPKPGHPTGWRHPGVADDVYMDAATFFPGMRGSFAFGRPDPTLARDYPQILGVIFHAQMMAGGQNTSTVKDVDDMVLNYSVGGGPPLLKKDAWVSRVSNAKAWFDGYYDASADREWTWADLASLRGIIGAQARRNPDQNRVASLWVVVKCYRPQDTAPIFYGRVESGDCGELTVGSGIYSRRFGAQAGDSFSLPVNRGRCPTPTPLPTVAVRTAASAPRPTPDPGVRLAAGRALGLGCLASAPEPFNFAGVFIKFCLKRSAGVRVRIFDAHNKVVRDFDGGAFNPGEGQIFFNAQDDAGKPLPPGSYAYQLEARDGEAAAQSQAVFTRAKDARR